MIEIAETKERGTVILQVAGRLDAATAGVLDARLRAMLAAGEKRIVLEVSGLEYVSSAGLRVILMLSKLLRAANGKFAMAEMRPMVQEVFDLAGFSTLCQVCPSRDDAVAAVL